MRWKKLCLPKDQGGLGFRDSKSFNLALLAKQYWRLVHNTNYMDFWILKSRYFPSCSFLDATVPSTRFVLEEGLLWRVGDGKHIRIWEDKWIRGGGGNSCLWGGFVSG